jgi:hypothetical protein
MAIPSDQFTRKSTNGPTNLANENRGLSEEYQTHESDADSARMTAHRKIEYRGLRVPRCRTLISSTPSATELAGLNTGP